ncbi:MAG: ABC transporter permease [Roseburia sp.]|nr:ABC transporter permease [Roseburia sp.]
MKQIRLFGKNRSFSPKKMKWMLSAVISFLCFLLVLAIAGRISSTQDTQQMAERWSDKKNVAQVSAFFSRDADITQNDIISFEHTLDTVLQEASITIEAENPDARLWADAYSASGKIDISSEQSSVTADAIGIGGDFFLFHPLKLVGGSYFSGNDINKDYCVIDEEAAWKLFGSSDVAGMFVYVNDTPLMVSGVVERPEGRLEEAAGLDGTVVYVSYELLDSYVNGDNGNHIEINHYEIVMPNPVSGFALQKVQEHLSADEREVEYLQNTNRYSLKRCLELLLAFGTRSMNGKAILYPYWENIARGYEDILALVTLLLLLLLLYSVVVVLVLFIIWWRHKGWTIKSVLIKLKDKIDRMREKNYAKRRNKKARKAKPDAELIE